jgi:hypothetical protein
MELFRQECLKSHNLRSDHRETFSYQTGSVTRCSSCGSGFFRAVTGGIPKHAENDFSCLDCQVVKADFPMSAEHPGVSSFYLALIEPEWKTGNQSGNVPTSNPQERLSCPSRLCFMKSVTPMF